VDRKFYCYYDAQSLEIVQIGANSVCDVIREKIKRFEIPFDPIARNILTGEIPIEKWEVCIKDGKEYLIKKEKEKEKHAAVKERTNILDLIEIENVGATTTPIKIYITEKNDPTVLLCALTLNKWAISKNFSVFTSKFNLN